MQKAGHFRWIGSISAPLTVDPILGTIIPRMGTARLTRVSNSVGAALFGATRQAVLSLLFGHPDQRFYQRQIIRALALGFGAVQRELEQLVGAGIVTRTIEGRQTYFQANRECPVFTELQGLVRKTFGVAQALQKGLVPLSEKVCLAFVYGSVAAGTEKAGSDIDVMVIGDEISLEDVVAAVADAQVALEREVNPSVYHTEEFYRKLAGGHHFLANVVAGPKIFLIGDEHELAGLAQLRMAQGAQDKPAGDLRPVRHRR